MVDKFIQRATEGRKPGKLSRRLGIPIEKNIPKTLLQKIKGAEAGVKIKNPTMTGKSVINVTPKLKKQANFALTLKKISENRRK